MDFDRVINESDLLVGYTTDVEGNLSFWNRYIEHSTVLSRVEDELILKENCQFVYGGDSCDRGSGDLQVLRDLISLKERYPDRVHLLMGNRDINKLRFPVAMLPEVLSLLPECYFALPSAILGSDDSYLFNDRASKMKWILTNTMGSPYAFEYRRQELQRSDLPCSDADVTDSFCDVMNLESGLMLRYLELAQVVAIIGDIMFLHGALHDFNQGFIPYSGRSHNSPTGKVCSCADLPTEHCVVDGYVVDDPFEWCEKINAFAAAEVQDFKGNITSYLASLSAEIKQRKAFIHQQLNIVDLTQYSDRELAILYSQHSGVDDSGVGIGASLLHDATSGYFHPQPGSALIQYGMGVLANGTSTRSVIYTSYLYRGRPNPCSDSVAQWLLRVKGEGSGDIEGVGKKNESCGQEDKLGEDGGNSGGTIDVASSGVNNADGTTNENNSSCGGKDKENRVVRRLVVGHQPHADAPLVLQVHGIQIISADSSYSVNTQWPLSQLQTLFPSTPCFVHNNTTTEVTATPEFSLSTPVENEEWLTFTEYKTRFLTCTDKNDDNAVNSGCSICVNEAIPSVADTRCPVCMAELLFVCYNNHSCDANCDHSNGYVHGWLSQGSYYVSTLNAISMLNSVVEEADVDTDMVDDTQNELVGRETKDGWYVKAANVRLPSVTFTAATLAVQDATIKSADDVDGECEWFYLLAHSAGYTFRNQLVAKSDIAAHFI